jgi:hypothetical protein
MATWGNRDHVTGNNKPIYANTSNAYSNSSINGTAANTNAYYGIVVGVSPGEMANTTASAARPHHAGWVSLKIGTGPIASISVAGGTGINANGFMIVTDTSVLGQGTGANISFTTANSQNTLERFSSNAQLNTFGTFTIVDGGRLYSNVVGTVVRTNGTAISNGVFTITLGGRAGRVATETLVSMGSMTFDDPRDNVFFSGI